MKHLYKTLFLILSVSVVSACVTQRKKDDVKGFKLFMHNLTAKYNGYFNADVLVKDATEKLAFQHQDNYNKIIDVYPYVAVDNFQSVAPDLDKAIEKVAVAATFHRQSHWTDDSYLMLGKAQFLKHDYKSAEESFQYLVDVYDPSLKSRMTPKERKKAQEEARKEKAEARKEQAELKKQEQVEKTKVRKEAAELAKKEKEEQAKKDKEDAEKRNKLKEEERKKAEELAKKERENKKESIADRNEARRKANDARRIENERKRKEAQKQGKNKVDDTEGVVVDKTTPAPKEQTPTKTGAVKTGSNSTPVFKPEETVKVSKKKGKPDKYFLKHRPCHQEGVVWLARTHIERQNFDEALLLLEDLEKNPKTFKDILAQVATAKAYLFLKQNNYESAVTALEEAVKRTKKKREKARLAFILAQVFQTLGNSEKAYAMFDKVLDNNPVYEMEFNARLNMALNSSTAAENTIAMLKKMSKDFKNREYGDQIYFALAQIALKNDQKDQAVVYLKESLNSGGKNKQQKAESYYLLAKLQFESEKYVEAKAYYDSAALVISENDPRKAEAQNYATNLVEISRNIQIVTLQDSLIRIAGLTEKEKRAVAINIKKDRIAKSAPPASIIKSSVGADIPSAGNNKSTFFAYNIDAVKKGKKEFEKKWGTDRKLEDNWQRSNKKGVSSDIQNTEIVSSEITDREVAEILKDVPKTVADMDAAKLKIDDALFELGTLYHDKLKNNKKSVEALEQDLSRFSATKHELDDWYYLYLSNTDLGNKAKASDYYDKIQAKYASSNYAQILKNPDAFKSKDGKSVEEFYAETYALFKAGDYKKTSDRIAESETTFGINNPLKAKFALLSAMCVGHFSGRDAYMTTLKDVIAKYAETPEEKRAKEILRILEYGTPVTESPKNIVDPVGVTANFKPEDDKFHYIIVVLPKDAVVEDAKIDLSDYNAKYHRLEDLKISSIVLSTESEIPILVIRRLKDKATSIAYTVGVKNNAADFIKGSAYEVFAVTQDNYREILRLKSLDEYRKFYARFYN